MAKKSRRGVRHDQEAVVSLLRNNARAVREGPNRKSWNIHDLRPVHPMSENQAELFDHWDNGQNLIAHGSAGTGKTFLALYLAFKEALVEKKQVIIVRSIVPTREVGHLPGTLEEKVAQYELPYMGIMHELIGRASTYSDMKEAGVIEFATTSFIRGITWDNAIIVVDEGENMTFHEIDSIMTRIGKDTRIIFTGDLIQTDLTQKKQGECGMGKFMQVADRMDEFSSVGFEVEDIVRSSFVKSWIIASNGVDKN